MAVVNGSGNVVFLFLRYFAFITYFITHLISCEKPKPYNIFHFFYHPYIFAYTEDNVLLK